MEGCRYNFNTVEATVEALWKNGISGYGILDNKA